MYSLSSYLIFQFIIICLSLQTYNTQATWTVQTGYYTTEIIIQQSEQFAYWLQNNVENSLSQPRSGGYCDRISPDFPLDSQILCGTKAQENICWKFEFTFRDAIASNYKLEVGGDFGRGMAMFVDGVPDVTIQSDVWWDLNFNNPGVLRLNFDFQAGTHIITFYGGENCCDGQQSIRFQRNNDGWKILTKANVENSIPFVCDHPCQKCSMDPSDCYTCIGDNRVLANVCQCKESYYEDSDDKICKQCEINCIECENQNVCLKCVEGFYLDVTSKNCYKCPIKFNTCKTELLGKQCRTGENRLDITQNCNCIDKYHANYDQQLNCEPCKEECLSCKSDSICTSCQDSFYLQNGQCLKCPYKFNKCIDKNIGQECSNGLNRKDIQKQCVCQNKYHDQNGQNLQDCIKCNDECSQCISQSICTQCEDSYYLENGQCIKCKQKYSKCTGNNQPIKCDGQNRKNESENCDCLDNYHDENGSDIKDCQLCNYECKTCISQDKCTQCIKGYYEKNNKCIKCQQKYKECTNYDQGTVCTGKNRKGGMFNCQCEKGFHDNKGQLMQDCIPCNQECKQCISQKECTQCNDQYYLNQIEKKCEKCLKKYKKCQQIIECDGENRQGPEYDCKCQEGFFDNGEDIKNCKKCNNLCKTCNNQNSCSSCNDGYYYNNDLQTCNKCKNKYKNCEDEDIGTKCDGENRLDIEQNCNCLNGFYEIQNYNQKNCSPCPKGCQNCIDQFKCIQPQEGYLVKNNQVFQCDNSYCGQCVENLQNCTVPCHKTCKTCNTQGKCQTCKISQFIDGEGYCKYNDISNIN